MRAFLLASLISVSLGLNAQDATAPDGSRYWGPLRDGKPHGLGRLISPNGSVYTGEFYDGLFHGSGRIEMSNGEILEGQFVEGQMTSRGPARRGAPGDLEAERRQVALDVESALLAQRPLLDAALASLTPRSPGKPNLFVLAVAGDGSQDVFRREVEYVRAQFDRDFGTRGHSVALVNGRGLADRAPMATLASMREALRAIAARMDRDNDILFLFLTSHGTREHELVLNQGGMLLRGLRPADLAGLLKDSGIRWKAVVVSACYGGGFLDALRDERTLVIAAARHDRQSFGCTEEAEFTWFGRAFFKDALAASGSFEEAFRKAQALVAEREAGKKIAVNERSLPQISSPRPISEQLKRWWPQSGN
ncbi:MAG TPA: C13 family peptidase [Burkholderiales bacterium]